MSVKSQQVNKSETAKRPPMSSVALAQVRGFAGNHTLMRKQETSDKFGAQSDQVTQRPVPGKTNGQLLQRKCACGGSGGECKACDEEKAGSLQRAMQKKLAVGEAGDRYEQEADRVADQVLAAPKHNQVSTALPHIQRVTGQSSGPDGAAAPASVDRVLSGPGQPLATSLRQDMEQRFGYDFSAVRVHSGSSAELSTREVNAHAYTVGRDIVFDSGRFAPSTHEGRRLLAHELTHVVQQSSSQANGLSSFAVSQQHKAIDAISPSRAGSRIQRKKRSEKNLSIVKIVAFEGRKDSAQAHLSDGTFEPVALHINTLAQGTYTLKLDHSQAYHYRFLGVAPTATTIRWFNKSVFQGEYQYAETVTVEILTGDPSTLRERIGALDPHVQDFLTSDKVGVTSYADMERVALAGEILASEAVTEDELLLIDQARSEAEARGQPLVEAEDPVDAAFAIVERRKVDAEKAFKNRSSIVKDRERLDTWSQNDKNVIKNVLDGHYGEKALLSIFLKHHMSYYELIQGFEVELRSITKAFLSQSKLALFRIENTYLGNKNVGVGEELLRQGIEKIRPALVQRDLAVSERNRRKFATISSHSPVILDLLDPKVAEAKAEKKRKLAEAEAEVKVKEEELQRQSAAAGLPVVSWKGFDLDAIRGGNVERSRSSLRQFVAHAHTQIRSAQEKVESLKTLYKADRMVELTKAAIGIKKGSVFDDLISYRASIETSDDGFWSTLWDIVTIALMFVPGNVGIALRIGAGVVDMTKALDEYFEGMGLYKADLASAAPSSLGVFLAVGGTFIDVPSMGKGVVKVLESEATAGAKVGSRAAKAGEDVADVASQARKVAGGKSAASAGIRRAETAEGVVVYHAAGHEFKVVGKRVIRCSEPACSDAVERLFTVYDDTIRKNPHLQDQLKEVDKALKGGDPDLAGRLSAQFEIDAQALRGYKTDRVERLIAEHESVITANRNLQERLGKIDEAVARGDTDLAGRLSAEFEKDAQRLSGFEKPGSQLERGRFEPGQPDPSLKADRPDIKEVNKASRAGIADREADEARSELRKNMGAPSSAGRGDWQAQHIIPLELRDHPLIRKMRNEYHWNMNGKKNGLHMPTREGVPGAEGMAIHRGPHQRYTGWVESDLDQLYQAWKAGDVPEKDILRKFEDVIGKFENVARESSFGVSLPLGGVHLK